MKSLVSLVFVGSIALVCAHSAHASMMTEESAGASATFGNVVSDYLNPPHTRLHQANSGAPKGLHQRQLQHQAKQSQSHQSHTKGSQGGTHSALFDRLHPATRDCTTSRRHPCPAPDNTTDVTQPPNLLFGPVAFNAPTGNLGESDAAGQSFSSIVTARHHRVRPVTPSLVPEPAPLLLLAIGVTALALVRRRNRPN